MRSRRSGLGLRTATRTVGFSCALGVAVRGLDERARALLATASRGVIVRSHTGPATNHVFITGHGTGRFSPLIGLSHGIEVGGVGGVTRIAWRLFLPPEIAATLGRSRVECAPAVAGSSSPRPMPSLQDLARLFLSLSGSREQWDAVLGSAFSTAAVSGAGFLPGPAALELSAATSECSSASVPAPGVSSPAGAASVTGSSGQYTG